MRNYPQKHIFFGRQDLKPTTHQSRRFLWQMPAKPTFAMHIKMKTKHPWKQKILVADDHKTHIRNANQDENRSPINPEDSQNPNQLTKNPQEHDACHTKTLPSQTLKIKARFINWTEKDRRRGERVEGEDTDGHESVELRGLDHLAEPELVLPDGGPARLARGPPGLSVLRLPGRGRRRHSAGRCSWRPLPPFPSAASWLVLGPRKKDTSLQRERRKGREEKAWWWWGVKTLKRKKNSHRKFGASWVTPFGI